MYCVAPSNSLQNSGLYAFNITLSVEKKFSISRISSQRLKYSIAPVVDTSGPEFHRNIEHFITLFVSKLPFIIKQFSENCEKIGWYKSANKINKIFSHIMNKNLNSQSSELIDILNQFYFSSRLIEELNDNIIALFGDTFIPWDMTTANLIIHKFIGEEYAEKMDQLSIEITQQLICNENKPEIPQCVKFNTQWPCFCEMAGLKNRLRP